MANKRQKKKRFAEKEQEAKIRAAEKEREAQKIKERNIDTAIHLAAKEIYVTTRLQEHLAMLETDDQFAQVIQETTNYYTMILASEKMKDRERARRILREIAEGTDGYWDMKEYAYFGFSFSDILVNYENGGAEKILECFDKEEYVEPFIKELLWMYDGGRNYKPISINELRAKCVTENQRKAVDILYDKVKEQCIKSLDKMLTWDNTGVSAEHYNNIRRNIKCRFFLEEEMPEDIKNY